MMQKATVLRKLAIAAILVLAYGTVPAQQPSVPFVVSEEKEKELGKELHGQMIAQMGVYPDPDLQAYVNEIGQKLAALSERPHLDWTFLVVDQDNVNAMALPGGYIYITRGLMAHLNTESELASVIGHEIGHVTARHFAKRNRSQQLANIGSAVAAVATRNTAIGQATNVAGGAIVSGFSRNQELEADGLGAKYVAKAGYSTDAVIRTVEVLKRREQFEIERARLEGREPELGHGLFATHPDNDKRFAEAIEAASEFQSDNPFDENTEAFLDRLNGMRWGPKRLPGVFRGNWYYHPKFAIKMKFPDEWRLGGKPGTIEALSPDNNAALQVFGVVPGRSMTPEDIIKRKLGLTRLRDGKAITVSGMQGYIAIADRWGSPFGPRPVRAAVVVDNRKRQAFVFAGTGRHDLSKIASDAHFIKTIFSFDHMTREEFSLAEPPQVKVVRAEEGTTFAELAKTAAVPAYAEQQLRLINGMYPRGEPTEGQLIKVID